MKPNTKFHYAISNVGKPSESKIGQGTTIELLPILVEFLRDVTMANKITITLARKPDQLGLGVKSVVDPMESLMAELLQGEETGDQNDSPDSSSEALGGAKSRFSKTECTHDSTYQGGAFEWCHDCGENLGKSKDTTHGL